MWKDSETFGKHAQKSQAFWLFTIHSHSFYFLKPPVQPFCVLPVNTFLHKQLTKLSCVFLSMTSGVGELILPLAVVSIATALTQEALKLQGEGLWQGSGFLALTGRIKSWSVTGLPSGLFLSLLCTDEATRIIAGLQSHMYNTHTCPRIWKISE